MKLKKVRLGASSRQFFSFFLFLTSCVIITMAAQAREIDQRVGKHKEMNQQMSAAMAWPEARDPTARATADARREICFMIPVPFGFVTRRLTETQALLPTTQHFVCQSKKTLTNQQLEQRNGTRLRGRVNFADITASCVPRYSDF